MIALKTMKTLAALVILSVVAGVTPVKHVTCRHPINCPCGSTGKNVKVCPLEDKQGDLCNRWSKCKTCQDGLDGCLEYLDELEGQFGSKGHCRELSRLKHGNIRCISNERQRTCVGKCLPGYSFEGHGSIVEMTLTCKGSYYTPLNEFPPCNSGGHCDLVTEGSGSFNCSSSRKGTQCDIICGGRYIGRYSCYPGQNWEPPLPHCVSPIEVEDDRQACDCKHGGSCDSHGHCICPVGRTGRFCEAIESQTRISFCRDPGACLNGSRKPVSPPNRQGFPQGSRIQYFCNEGYVVDGERSIFCLTSGKWSARIPRCSPQPGKSAVDVHCLNPGSISNGRIMYYPPLNSRRRAEPETSLDDAMYPKGGLIRYSCDVGYILVGSDSLTCGETGEWSSAPPVCRGDLSGRNPTFCRDPGVDPNGSRRPRLTPVYQGFPNGTLMNYFCNPGYDLDGEDTIYCLSGKWLSERPKCNPQSRDTDCGIKGISRRIKNGNITVTGEWPWVVAIAVSENNHLRLICGGALLNTRTVITAAHCVTDHSRFILFFGKFFSRFDLDDDQVENRTSDGVIISPDYNNVTLDSDVALVTFRPRIEYSERVQPICLPTAESTLINLSTPKKGYVTGWGYTERRLGSDILLMAHLPYVTNNDCMESFRENAPNFNAVLTQNMFCAGYTNANQTTCRGDSGSPFVFYDPLSKKYTMEGLVSFSVEGQCGLPGIYSVFTKVYRFKPWILSYM